MKHYITLFLLFLPMLVLSQTEGTVHFEKVELTDYSDGTSGINNVETTMKIQNEGGDTYITLDIDKIDNNFYYKILDDSRKVTSERGEVFIHLDALNITTKQKAYFIFQKGKHVVVLNDSNYKFKFY